MKRMKHARSGVALGLAALCVQGCTSIGNLGAIKHKAAIAPSLGQADAPAAMFVDAEQRAILSNPDHNNGTGGAVDADDHGGRRIVCAEPSPDAISAFAAAAGVSLSNAQQALSAETSLSEAAANIGLRTQTIQILRDGFYRLCESYMNGLARDTYTINLEQYQRLMVGMLAIEQLTSTVRGPDALVAASTTGGFDQSAMHTHRANLAKAEIARLDREIAAETERRGQLQQELADCEQPECTEAQKQALETKIKASQAREKALNQEKDIATANRDTATTLAGKEASDQTASAGGIVGSLGYYPPQGASVADTIYKITELAMERADTKQICLEYMRYARDNPPPAERKPLEESLEDWRKQKEEENQIYDQIYEVKSHTDYCHYLLQESLSREQIITYAKEELIWAAIDKLRKSDDAKLEDFLKLIESIELVNEPGFPVERIIPPQLANELMGAPKQ